jgi:hypothetical protein
MEKGDCQMKKVTIATLILLVLFLVAADLPPQIPSSFYGYINNGRVGMVVNAEVGGKILASTTAFAWNGKVVYTIDVPPENIEGSKVNFRINGLIVGYGYIHSGTNVQVDLTVKTFWTRLFKR